MTEKMSSKERLKYYKSEWRKKNILHIFLHICLWLAVVTAARTLLDFNGGMLGGVSGLVAAALYGKLNNEMMKYAEDRAFDGSGD